MKSKVLDRAMFKEGGMPDVNNVGIMDGFMEQLDEMFEDDMEDEGEEYETGKMMDRTPSSPEILMNNLRGDMRSVDARREELADMVGYNAAMETPDEVLALLQARLAEEQMAGIGGLPGAMPPPPAMPQGAPPQGAMPMDQGAMPPAGGIEALMGAAPPGQPPMQMANGGYVQNFADGSDEDGVTPYGSESSSYYDPAIRDYASQQTMQFLQQQPRAVPDLRSSMEERLPLYQELIGAGDDSRNMTQAQMLFALSQAAFNYAGNVDAQGRPLRGSQLARAAQAFAPVPGQIGALAAAQRKEDRAVKLAALEAGEKDVQSIREYNRDLLKEQRRMLGDIAKSDKSASSMFGKSDFRFKVATDMDLLSRALQGKETAGERALLQIADTEFLTRTEPSTEIRKDKRGNPYEVVIPGQQIPNMWQDLIKARPDLRSGIQVASTAAPSALPDVQEEAAISANIPAARQPIEPPTEQVTSTAGKGDAQRARDFAKVLEMLPEDASEEEIQAAQAAQRSSQAFAGGATGGTLWDAYQVGVGLWPTVSDFVASNAPIDAIGALAPDIRNARSAIRTRYPILKTALRPEEGRLLKDQYKDIEKSLAGLDLSTFSNVPAYGDNLIEVTRALYTYRDNALNRSMDTKLPIEEQNKARTRYEGLNEVIETMLGTPRPISSEGEFWALKPGEGYLSWSETRQRWVAGRKPTNQVRPQ